MWSDNETINDLIGFNVHKDLIKSVVTNPDLLPVTMGVFGDWGSGKTSIMKMLEHDLNPENYDKGEEKEKYENILCVYFNGWMFEGYDDAKAAILDEVLEQIKNHKKFGPKVKEKVTSLMESVDWMRMAQVGVKEIGLPALSAYLTGGLSLIPQIFKNGEGSEKGIDFSKINIEGIVKKQDEVHMDVRTFRDRFAEMIEETEISSLVVLIDDLDRCSPERIIDNLEAIKLFLNVDKTAFVIGADPRIVKHAIQERYNNLNVRKFNNGESDNDSLINDYLEKLIQVPYHLPRMSPAEVETYMTLLFCKRDIEDKEIYSKILSACKEQQSNNRYATFGYSSVLEVCERDELPDKLIQSLISNSRISPLITEGLKGNPRQIKRFLNAYTLRKQLAEVAYLDNIRDDILVKLMVLEYTYRENFQQLFNWQSKSEGHPEQIVKLEEILTPPNGDVNNEDEAKKIDSQWSNSFIRKWLSMEPHLTNIDLRDYFWIARDKLSSTFSGLSMVPPIVRTVLEGLISGNEGKVNQSIRKSKDLNQDEIDILLDLLSSHVIRNPKEIAGFKAIRRLIDEGVQGSLEKLINTVYKCPPHDVPVAAVIDLKNLIKAKPQIKGEMAPVMNWLKENNSEKPVGRALIDWEVE